MPTPTQSIRELLNFQNPLSDSEVLQLLKIARDQLLLSVFEGEAVTYLEIRNRRVQVSDPKALLQLLEDKLIPKYEALVAAQSGRSATNYAVLKKA